MEVYNLEDLQGLITNEQDVLIDSAALCRLTHSHESMRRLTLMLVVSEYSARFILHPELVALVVLPKILSHRVLLFVSRYSRIIYIA